MQTKIGGVMKHLRTFSAVFVTIAAVGLASPASAANDARERSIPPVALIKDMALAAIEVAKEAAQATSDTVHHNMDNIMGTAAKARGFVRDSVGGVLGNARKLTGMVGDMMPLTTHNHYAVAIPSDSQKGKQAN